MPEATVAVPQEAENWESNLRLVCDQLNEKHRRWVAALVSMIRGWGGVGEVARITGLDPKTVQTGRRELEQGLAECPPERVRRKGAGRPRAEKKTPHWKPI
jgi:hypothetical protein